MQYNWPLIGHDHIRQYFEKALSAGRVNHAYLFEGPEHVGKATLARLLAKTLLCEIFGNSTSVATEVEPRHSTIPCDVCRACQAFDHGAHPDFLRLARQEDDSTISVEAMREYIVALHTKPLLGKRRVGIMEEAELMAAAGSNAFLKTLEEPPGQAVVFLVSHQPVLPTIASRCQRVRFGFVAEQNMDGLGALYRAHPAMRRIVSGRPGLAAAFQDQARCDADVERLKKLVQVLAQDEGARLLWISQLFGARVAAAEKREECRNMIAILQALLRENLHDRGGVVAGAALHYGAMLKRTLEAENYLRANVDVKLICEYIF